MTMDCRTCEPSLVDLLYGELEPERAREAQAHIADCESCRASFERLQQGLSLAQAMPAVEPPGHVAAQLMELAEVQAGKARERRREEEGGALSRLLRLLTGGAMATQVKMAMVTAVVVAAVLWIVPHSMQDGRQFASGPVVSPDPGAEAAPSEGVTPADPLELQMDLRSGRIRAKGDLEAKERLAPAAAEEEVVAELEAPASSSEAEDALLDGLVDLAEADEDLGKGADGLATGDQLAAAEGQEKAEARAAPAAARATSRRARGDLKTSEPLARLAAPAPEPTPFPAQTRSAVKKKAAKPAPRAAGGYGEASLEAAAEAPAARQQAFANPAKESANGTAGATEPRQLLEQASRKAAAGDRQGALRDLARVAVDPRAGSLRAEALLRYARLERRWSGCARAVPRYQQVVDRHPSSSQAGFAMLEGAECLRTTGRVAEARRLLERARNHPVVAQKALAELDALSAPATEAPSKAAATDSAEAEAEAAPE